VTVVLWGFAVVCVFPVLCAECARNIKICYISENNIFLYREDESQIKRNFKSQRDSRHPSIYSVWGRKQSEVLLLGSSRNDDVGKYCGTRHSIFRHIIISATPQWQSLQLLLPCAEYVEGCLLSLCNLKFPFMGLLLSV